MSDLAERAVKAKGWRWMPGMLARRVTSVCEGSHRYTDAEVRVGFEWPRGLPDLDDPATKGCLLILVRAAWQDPEAHLALGGSGWVLLSGESRVATVVYPSDPGATEAEALVHALECAP